MKKLLIVAMLATPAAYAGDPVADAKKKAKEESQAKAGETAKDPAKMPADDGAMKKDEGGHAVGTAGDARAKEDALHEMRLAKIARIEELGKEGGKQDLVAKAAKLRELEDRRHEKALRRIAKHDHKDHKHASKEERGERMDDMGKGKSEDKAKDKAAEKAAEKGKGKDKDKGGKQ